MADSNNKDLCNFCKFFSSGERLGICKRYPEPVNKSKDDWCGEFLSQKINLPINNMIQSISEPVVLNSGQKKAGRPRKYA
jgi:hypothetical protein